MMMGPTLWGLDVSSLLMLISGVFYVICAIVVYRSYRTEKSELIGALLAFLAYQSVSMFFMGVEMLTHNLLYGNIAGFAVILGSAYMLKFPLSKFSAGVRRSVFFIVLIAAFGVIAWFMQSIELQKQLMSFVLWYDLVVNGIIAGGSIVVYGLKVRENNLKVKALTGGTGVLSCCMVANGFMLTGSMIIGSLVGFLAPLFILGSLKLGKKS